MALLLNIETTTKVCSVSLSKNGELIALKESNEQQFSHSERLNEYIHEIFTIAALQLKELDAIAVSIGPGSYTGLRIGVSTAKGLAYGLNIPIVAVDTLSALCALTEKNNVRDIDYIIPMIDARRMEVFTAVYKTDGSKISETQAIVLDENSFQNYKGVKLLIGDGAEKCKSFFSENPDFQIDADTLSSAKGMCLLGNQLFEQKNFVDTAYFEPFYLKDFVATTPKKLL